ncbi:alpha/beta hydrolase family protein [Brevundimonas sp.]|uniref:alpha/beta hydrolase family protein n=1 Tax=Brevundimonas sp. TaxID=1871086 RepID=UPI0025BC5324|nr:S9 family peptidase [Brevundimonas sp.]
MKSVFRSGLTAAVAGALAAVLTVTLPAAPASAQNATAAETAASPLDAYGALPSLEMLRLSPSGDKLAFITVAGEQRTLVLLDLTTRSQIGGVDVGRVKVRDLDWIGEERVLVSTSATLSLPRLGIEAGEFWIGKIYDPGRNRAVEVFNGTRGVFPAMMSNARILDNQNPPALLVRAFAFENPERMDLYRIDLNSGRASLAEVMGRRVESFILDPSGQSLARSEYDPSLRSWSLLARQGSSLKEIYKVTAPLDSPSMLGLGMNGDSLIVAADRPDLHREGREDAEFFDVNIATGAWRPLRFEFRPQGIFFDPLTSRMIGAAGEGEDGPRYVFVEPRAGAMWTRVQQSFAGRAPHLVSWTPDFKTVVVRTAGDRDSGSFFVLDMDAGTITPAGGSYAALTPDRVGLVRSVRYAAADGTQIHGFMTLPPGVESPRNLPLVVLAHGGPASHDVGGFDWWAQAIASRGYVVLQPNFRGSTGYGKAFMEAGYGEWGRKMQTDLSDGVRWMAEQGMIDPSRVCIVGASYGGYAAMAGPTLDRGVYRCAVSYGGVSDLYRMVNQEARDGARRDNETVRYWNRFMGVERLDHAVDRYSPALLAAQADAPILLIHGRDDTVVPIEQSRVMADALRRAGKPYELIEMTGEDHWLSRSDTRQRMLNETVRFLEAHNPPR